MQDLACKEGVTHGEMTMPGLSLSSRDWIWIVCSQDHWCVSMSFLPKYSIITQIIWLTTLSGMIQLLLSVYDRGMIVLPFEFLVRSWSMLPCLQKWRGVRWVPARVLGVRVSSVGPFQQTGTGHWCWGGESYVLSTTFQSIKKNQHKAVNYVWVIPAGVAFMFIFLF